ncbi:hypothetical protein EDB19DRAFT_2022410 [Suillus lakei]|nr:hypothetical protein EDB19DRAFT_2022410 [Suillus lakei]
MTSSVLFNTESVNALRRYKSGIRRAISRVIMSSDHVQDIRKKQRYVMDLIVRSVIKDMETPCARCHCVKDLVNTANQVAVDEAQHCQRHVGAAMGSAAEGMRRNYDKHTKASYPLNLVVFAEYETRQTLDNKKTYVCLKAVQQSCTRWNVRQYTNAIAVMTPGEVPWSQTEVEPQGKLDMAKTVGIARNMTNLGATYFAIGDSLWRLIEYFASVVIFSNVVGKHDMRPESTITMRNTTDQHYSSNLPANTTQQQFASKYNTATRLASESEQPRGNEAGKSSPRPIPSDSQRLNSRERGGTY